MTPWRGGYEWVMLMKHLDLFGTRHYQQIPPDHSVNLSQHSGTLHITTTSVSPLNVNLLRLIISSTFMQFIATFTAINCTSHVPVRGVPLPVSKQAYVVASGVDAFQLSQEMLTQQTSVGPQQYTGQV